MIGVIVTFRSDHDLDRSVVAKIAEEARGMFEGMPGLRSKVFTIDPSSAQARNFYVWDSEEAARGFFSDALVERVTGLYGVKPIVEFVDVLALVDNANASV
jgi:uncharacterized protein YfiM (DUF2279 family)